MFITVLFSYLCSIWICRTICCSTLLLPQLAYFYNDKGNEKILILWRLSVRKTVAIIPKAFDVMCWTKFPKPKNCFAQLKQNSFLNVQRTFMRISYFLMGVRNSKYIQEENLRCIYQSVSRWVILRFCENRKPFFLLRFEMSSQKLWRHCSSAEHWFRGIGILRDYNQVTYIFQMFE